MRNNTSQEERSAAAIARQIQELLSLVIEQFSDLFAPARYDRIDPEPVEPRVSDNLLRLLNPLTREPRAEPALISPRDANREEEAYDNHATAIFSRM